MTESMDVFEAMGTARAMRYLRSDPVPDELLERVLWAATRASNPGNVQPWAFVVVRDAEVRAAIGELFRPVLEAMAASGAPASPEPSGDPAADATEQRTIAGARNLIGTFAQVPVMLFVCGANVYPAHEPDISNLYSAVYAAAQNAVVAARAVGLGAAFTTLHKIVEPGLRELLAIPADQTIGVTLALGYPGRPFGPVTRGPLEEVVHHDRW